MTIHTMSNYINESSNHTTFQYDYAFTFQDKVYASEMSNKNIFSQCLNLAEGENKLSQIHDSKVNLALTKELNLQLSKAFDSNVKSTEINTCSESYKDEIWITNQQPGDIIPLHTSNGEVSFIIFDDDFEVSESYGLSGCIEFVSSISNSTMKFKPKPNNIFIFNSNHMRMVYPPENGRNIITGNIHKFELHL